jgi:hypothetical protein
MNPKVNYGLLDGNVVLNLGLSVTANVLPWWWMWRMEAVH